MTETHWFYVDSGTTYGPVTTEDLADRLTSGLPSDTFVWHTGLPSWVTAAQVPELTGPQWFYTEAEETYGPITARALIDLLLTRLPPQTQVWRDGLPDWVRADEVPELVAQMPPPLTAQQLSPNWVEAPGPPPARRERTPAESSVGSGSWAQRVLGALFFQPVRLSGSEVFFALVYLYLIPQLLLGLAVAISPQVPAELISLPLFWAVPCAALLGAARARDTGDSPLGGALAMLVPLVNLWLLIRRPHDGVTHSPPAAAGILGFLLSIGLFVSIVVLPESRHTSTTQDPATLAKACSLGDMGACTTLGEILEQRQNGEQDLVNALRLYQRACSRQYEPACTHMRRLLARAQGSSQPTR